MINAPFDMVGYWPTGSRYICNPPPMDTDDDTAILVKDLVGTMQLMKADGWKIPEDGGYDMKRGTWFSAKKTVDGTVHNFIVTDDEERHFSWVTATELAKKLNLLKKEDRIALFSVIVDKERLF